ncbi:MAG: hypothetical protein AAB268_05240 [Elusimicrobiota bacterium]
MQPITIPSISKTSHPLLTAALLALVGVAIGFVCYLMLRHQYRTRNAKKHKHSPHTGHHDNH